MAASKKNKNAGIVRDGAHPNLQAVFALLAVIQQSDGNITQRELADRLGLSRATITRLLRDARTSLHMKIEWRENRYSVQSWGLIDPRALARYMPKRAP